MDIPIEAKQVIKQLNNNGYEAYIVGGCVRDHLLGNVPKDWDITTSALPHDVKRLFTHTFDTGIQHGTITVLIDNISFEVTTYRIDGDYKDNRHPEEVVFTDKLSGDLSRRDFTMNAIAYNDDKGFVDLFNGLDDIKSGIIRGVGIPSKRFQEDALRMLRAVRFSAQLGFKIEPATLNALIENAHLIQNISIERIRDEFTKLLISPNPNKLLLLRDTSLMKYFLPEGIDILKNEHLIPSLEISPNDITLRLSLLFNSLNKKNVSNILKRLRFDNKTNSRVSLLVEYSHLSVEPTRYEISKLLSNIGPEAFEELITLKRALKYEDNILTELISIYNGIIANNYCYSLKTLAINGNDLQLFNLANGKLIGEKLQHALDIVLHEPTLNNKEILMNILKEE